MAGAGFAQALAVAGFAGPAPTLPAWLTPAAQLVTSQPRGGRNAKPQAKQEEQPQITAAVTLPSQAPTVLPIVIQPFSRETGNRGQSPKTAASPAETPAPVTAASPAAEGSAQTGQRPAPRGADAPGISPAPNPPNPQTAPSAAAGDLAVAARVQPAAETPAPAPSADPAVAARVQPATETPQPARPAQHEPAAGPAADSKKAIESAADGAAAVPPVAGSSGAQLASYGQGFAQPQGPAAQAAAPAAPAPPAAPQAIPEPQPKAASTPLKDISIQVAQPGTQKVEVRVVQQSGELRVAVRTGDSDLAHGLQQNLSDLVGRLQETGFRAEGWRPGASSAQPAAVLDSRTSPGSSRNGDSQSDSGGSQGQEGQRRQNQSQRPAWVEELDRVAGNQPSQGVSYGIGS